MSRQSNEQWHNIRFSMPGIPYRRQAPGFTVGILVTVAAVVGILFWFLLFNREDVDSTKALVVEIVVMLITLALNIYMLCRRGYPSFSQNLAMSYFMNLFFSVVGLYIAGVRLGTQAGDQLEEVWRFLSFLFMAALMSLVPTLIICALMWVIASIFGTPVK